MAGNYIISDTHFHHKNIIELCNRPFDNVKEMDEYMINQWNKTVKKHDTIFHLGDFGFGKSEEIQETISKLNGRKILIMGNHDRRITKNVKKWIEMGFDEVYKYPILYKKFFWLSHQPIESLNENMPYINLHGHIHNNILEQSCFVNFSVEQKIVNYAPQNLDLFISNFRKIIVL